MKNILWILLGCSALISCSKDDFLDKKPKTNLVVPTTLKDFQALMDQELTMAITPMFGDLSSDNYYMEFPTWEGLNVMERNAYTWKSDIFEGNGKIEDWNLPYQQIFIANVVLEGLEKIAVTDANRTEWEHVKGSALFFRAYAYHNLAIVFAPAYDPATASKEMGLPLRLKADINAAVTRASLQETMDRILEDLHAAGGLLSTAIPDVYRNRPSRPTVAAALARVYLGMQAYDKALTYADSCLKMYDELIDYNTVPSGVFPFQRNNAETFYQSRFTSITTVMRAITATGTIVDSTLYRSYSPDDLRPGIFFRMNSNGKPIIGAGYSRLVSPFSGLATDEQYLIRAECYARANQTGPAMSDLNALLVKRYRTNTFTPLTAADPADALQKILLERRKEMPFRGVRFSDLKRLRNVTIKRILNGQTYELAPGDPRYAIAIPPDEIALSGIPQNKR